MHVCMQVSHPVWDVNILKLYSLGLFKSILLWLKLSLLYYYVPHFIINCDVSEDDHESQKCSLL